MVQVGLFGGQAMKQLERQEQPSMTAVDLHIPGLLGTLHTITQKLPSVLFLKADTPDSRHSMLPKLC